MFASIEEMETRIKLNANPKTLIAKRNLSFNNQNWYFLQLLSKFWFEAEACWDVQAVGTADVRIQTPTNPAGEFINYSCNCTSPPPPYVVRVYY